MDIEILEERRAFRAGPPAVTDIPCSDCRSPLIKDEFVLGFRLMCDNHECPLFREGQGIELKEPVRRATRKTLQPGYQRWLIKRQAQRQERYDYAKSLGIGSYRASKLRDRTRTDIEEFAKRDY